MKKTVWIIVVLLFARLSWGEELAINPQNLSLKAGPTEPSENLSLVWVESFVYPKNVKESDEIALGVKTTAKIRSVRASFDFNNERLQLVSKDGLSWTATFKVPDDILPGVHIVRYQINGLRGMIQRTVEFFIEDSALANEGQKTLESDELAKPAGWPLTVVASGTAITGNSTRNVNAGQKITGLSKVPWYKVLFADGSEGWIPAEQVKDPTDDILKVAYNAYKAKNFPLAIKQYFEAIKLNPDSVKSYTWIAKCYLAQSEYDASAQAIQKALIIDDRDLDARVVANTLAQKLFVLAQKKMMTKRYHEAIASFRRILAIKSNSTLSWIGIGEAYRRLGMEGEARDAWREALKYDPENRELHALLKTGYYVDKEAKPEAENLVAVSEKAALPPMLADDSLAIVKGEKTTKGTKIESAIKSVVALTKSLGTQIAEKGWQIKKQGNKLVASYVCEQSGGQIESFDWLVDVDTRRASPSNDNARLLMSRW